MRIISKFRDYYDSAQGHGVDPGLIYRRSTRKHNPEGHLWKYAEIRKIGLKSPVHYCKLDVKGHLVAFCGKLFPVWKCGNDWCWTADEVGEYLKRVRKSDSLSIDEREWIDDFDEVTRYKCDLEDEHRFLSVSRVDIGGFVTQFKGMTVEPEIHREYDSPVLLLLFTHDWGFKDIELVADPCLNEIRSYTQLEPFTAYQEIAMFLVIELAQPDIAPQTVGDDKTIAQSKGFNEQSFRTSAPGNKKLNRTANKARKRKGQSKK